MADKRTYEIETSITTDYRKWHWGLERIVLDTASNHLPSDSKASNFSIKFKQDGRYVDFKEVDTTKKTEEVIFEDNGVGYDAGLLSLLFSPKAADVLSVGQFGEGLKLVASAALRNNLQMEYRSRNWIAQPFVKNEIVDGHRINRLCFRVTENGDHLEGSRTVFTNPSEEFITEVKGLPGKVLVLNDNYKELYNEKDKIKSLFDGFASYGDMKLEEFNDIKIDYKKIDFGKIDFNYKIPEKYNSRIIELSKDSFEKDESKNSLFIKGIKVQDLYSLFSYDLGIDDITPDRAYANHDKVLDSIGDLLKTCSNTEIIKTILLEANANPHSIYSEFRAFENRSQHMNDQFKDREISFKKEIFNDRVISFKKEIDLGKWASTFRETFGENAILASDSQIKDKDLELMGYRIVKMPTGLNNYLAYTGIKTAYQIEVEKEYKWVDKNDLTPDEKNNLDKLREVNKALLEDKVDVDVRIYSGLFTKTGREIESALGVCTTESDGKKYIGLKRSLLSDPEECKVTYVHELGHYITGAGDADRKFADYFIRKLSEKI